MTQYYCYVNGELVEVEKANVSVFDRGFTVADGVFETLKFTSGTVFALDRHLRRLEKSCSGLGIAFPEKQLVRTAISQVCDANKHLAQGRMRITVTSGSGPLGSERIIAQPTLVVSVAEQKSWPETTEVLLVPWIRNEKSPLAGVKTTSYAENVYALAAAQSFGFSEAIFLTSTGLLSEGSGSNIFLVKDSKIYTPDLNSGLLAGITRELVLEWCDSKIEVCDLTEQDLFNAQEIFITSSTRDVHPVTRLAKLTHEEQLVQDKSLTFGSVTRELMRNFKKQSSEQLNP